MTFPKDWRRLLQAFMTGICFCILVKAAKEGTIKEVLLYGAILVLNVLVLAATPKQHNKYCSR
jgi:hypothetical protein